MLKITVLLQAFVANKMLAANEIDDVEGDDELIEKYEKLSKTRNLFKFQKSAKSEKKISKSRNLSNFNAKKNRLSFLISNARTAFSHL